MIKEQDIFLLGTIHCLKSILKSLEESNDEKANDIDFKEVLEMQRRNLSDPDLEEEYIVDTIYLEDWK